MNKFWSTILAGAAGGLLTFGAAKFFETPQVVSTNPAPVVRQVNYGGAPVPFDFTKAAEKSMSAVVHIKASESQQLARQRQQERRYTDPFEYFFGRNFDYQPQPRSGTGSGVIYTSDGYILTNNHVVEFADEFEVTLHDNREFKGRLVGRDDNTDMAVIKIDAKDLPSIELGNSDDVKVGEWALAVGNPFDLTSTVTAGIISAKGRDINIIKGGAAIESFIQTDAAVNPGNSGGALVDVNGRLIGINSAIATPTGVFAGYSFAIPVNLVKRIADDLIKYGEFRRAYLGVDIAPMDSYLANKLGVDYVQGVAVMKVHDDGSAASSGIQFKDVVTKINGKNVTSTSELRELVGRSKLGETVMVTVVRDGKEKDIPVRLKTRNDN
ncbi:MAG: PDZ domain-containing protein [Haliscomenobacteraceae bacterium CHB4]|nr:Periplasmic pH-dependent serine endoprotease DegQ [Saprospiraceae bacterium]MCE7921756.1 PDZ domain-containing protein [Haliscomenobacteraceae bacterium CHB4]